MRNASRTAALSALAAVSIAVNAFMWLRSPDSLPLLVKRTLVDGDKSGMYLNTALDGFLDANLKGENIVLRFSGFKPLSEEDDADVPLMIYERMVFHQYPAAVHAAPDDRVVNAGAPLIERPFSPSRGWMAERGVTAVLTIRHDRNGAIRTAIDRVGNMWK